MPRMLCLAVLLSLIGGLPAGAAGDEPSPQNPGVFEREVWTRPATSAEALLDDATFAGRPARREIVAAPIGASDVGDGFVQRIRGWIAVPATGSYRFAISSDDDAVLLISSGGDPTLAAPIASVTGFSGPLSFDGEGQRSKPITLIKGQTLYLEARHRDVSGTDHLLVAWEVPRSGFDRPMPIGVVIEPAFTLEVWNGVAEGDPASLPVFARKPNRTTAIFEAATPKNVGSNIAARITGSWTAPGDGEYVFMLSADDRAWLAVRPAGGGDPLGTASLASWTNPDEFDGRPGQVTGPIALKKGDVVALEARLWQGTGPGHLAIGVRGGGLDQRPITSPLVIKPETGS